MSQTKTITLPIEIQFRPTYGEYKNVEGGTKSRPQLHFLFLAQKRKPVDVLEDPVDPWQVRNEFFAHEDGTVVSFAQKYGRFAMVADIRCSVEDPRGIKEFRYWQRLIGELMTTPSSRWKDLPGKYDILDVRTVAGYSLPMQVDWRDGVPYGVVKVRTVRDAILATIHIDFLQGARFRHCARPDCSDPPFRLETRHDKKFCSYECAHLEVVRRGRKEKAEKRASRQRTKA